MSLNRTSTEVPKSSNKNHPLWTLLGPSKDVDSLTTMNLNSAASSPTINSRDKTSTSLRLLLCDTQRTMEGFSSQIMTLTKGLGDAKREIEEAGKIVEDGHIKAAEDVRLLLARMQVNMTKSLDLVNTSLSRLIEKSDTQQASFLSKQDSLQNQIMTLVQRLGIEHETKRLQDIEQKRWNEKHELDFSALMEKLENQQTVISGQALSIVSLRESVDSLKENISIVSKTMATTVRSAGSTCSVPDSCPEASTMIQPDLLERPTTSVPDIIPQEELIIRDIHNSSNGSGPPSNTSVPQGTFLPRLTSLRRTTYPKLPDRRGFEAMFPPSQVHPQQYRSLSRSSVHRIHSSPRDNSKPSSSSSPLAVLSSPLNKPSNQNHAPRHPLSVTPQSLKRPFSATSVPAHAAGSGSPLFSKGSSVSLPRIISSSISRPRPFIPLRVISGKSYDNSGGARLESEIQLVEHTRKKIKGNSRMILQDEGPRGAWNLETQTKDLWMT